MLGFLPNWCCMICASKLRQVSTKVGEQFEFGFEETTNQARYWISLLAQMAGMCIESQLRTETGEFTLLPVTGLCRTCTRLRNPGIAASAPALPMLPMLGSSPRRRTHTCPRSTFGSIGMSTSTISLRPEVESPSLWPSPLQIASKFPKPDASHVLAPSTHKVLQELMLVLLSISLREVVPGHPMAGLSLRWPSPNSPNHCQSQSIVKLFAPSYPCLPLEFNLWVFTAGETTFRVICSVLSQSCTLCPYTTCNVWKVASPLAHSTSSGFCRAARRLTSRRLLEQVFAMGACRPF